ncbi:MAG: hypothetical protein EOM47_11225 [Bacteroidia bacterium]|nr:hypothetical protein [Bacteroidia bacterium]
MKYIIKKNLVVLLLLFSISIRSQINCDNNYGFSRVIANKYVDWIYSANFCKFTADSLSVSVSDKEKIVISYIPPRRQRADLMSEMKFELKKILVLPKNKNTSSVKLSLDTKMVEADSIEIYLQSIDKSKNVLDYTKTIIKNNNGKWQHAIARINVEMAQAVRVNINYQGTKKLDQQVIFKNLSIKVDGVELSKYYSNEINKNKDLSLLKPQFITKLNENDLSGFSNIEALKSSRIIGLGEFTHGVINTKKTLKQLTEYLIREGNLKVIGIEFPIDNGLLFDLYIQGDTSQYLKESIQTCFKQLFCDAAQEMIYLDYLRDVNKERRDKIHIVGFDGTNPPQYFLFNYFITALGKERAFKYLKMLYMKNNMSTDNFSKLTEMIDKDIYLKDKIGETSIEYLKKFLNEYIKYVVVDNTYPNNRDSLMFEWVKNIKKIYLKEGGQMLLFGHSGHLSKDASLNKINNKIRLGCFLDKMYGSNYFNISIQGGLGEYKVESDYFRSLLIDESMKCLPALFCFENEALKLNEVYFYYPSKQIPDNLVLSREIDRFSRFFNQISFGNLQKNFDGYIFTRNCTPISINEYFLYQSILTNLFKKNNILLNELNSTL